ncbi:MAG: type II secretion system F family protein [Bacillota bacterium]
MLFNVVLPLLISIVVFIITLSMFKGNGNYLELRFKRLDNKRYKFDKNKNIINDNFFNRVVKPGLERVAELANKVNKNIVSTGNIKNQLIWAGDPYNLSPEQFLGVKIGLAVILPLITLIYYVGLEGINIMSASLVVFSLGLGYFLPDIIVTSMIKKRRLAIRKELPSVLDIMSVSSDAGLDFISAIQKMVDKKSGVLPDEFKIVLYELQVGESRTKALNELAFRCNTDEISRFVNAINQSEKYGTSISKILKSQAKFVRQSLKNKSEEKVQKAQSKLIIPLILFSLPSVFIIILGPALLQMIGAF